MTIVRPTPIRDTEDTERSIAQWEAFLRRQDAHYAELAAQRGEPYTPLSAEEIEAAAELVSGRRLPLPFLT